jgi:hypothetical protein
VASDGGVVGAVAGVASVVGSTAAVAVEATAVTTGCPVRFSFGSGLSWRKLVPKISELHRPY